MQKLWIIKCLLVFFLMSSQVVLPKSDFPAGNKLWSKDSRTMMLLSCKPLTNKSGDINCNIIETRFRLQATPEELKNDLARKPFREDFDKNGKIKGNKLAEICPKERINSAKNILGYDVSNKDLGISKKDFEKLKKEQEALQKKLSVEEKQDKLEALKIILNFCKKGDYQSFLRIGIHEHKIKEKTCSVSYSFRQDSIFKKIKDGLFVHEERENFTECAQVFFDTIRRKSQNSWDWEFEYKTISLNPEGRTVDGKSCKVVESREVFKPILVTGNVHTGCSYFQ